MRSARLRTPARPRIFADFVAAIALLSLACQTAVKVNADGRIVSLEHGYSIAHPAHPAGAGSAWQLTELDGATLAFLDGRGGSLMMLRECRGNAEPSLLARQLRIGIERAADAVSEAHAVELNGDAGWAQSFVVVEGAAEVKLRSVTLSAGLCTYDWVLVGAGDADREASFDRWWRSFLRSEAPSGAPQ